MRKLATIRRIDAIKPIEGADAIQLAVFSGWQSVVKCDENYKVGDLVVYCEIDSKFPEKPEYEFLRSDKFILRTRKFRGAISQGLVLRIPNDITPDVGMDVTEHLGITLYEAPIPANLSGQIAGKFLSSIPKTDEERIQNLDINELKGRNYWISEKVDGSSLTFAYDNLFHVMGRNWEYKETADQTFWKLARKYEIETKMRAFYERTGRHIALQGECIGESIQGNPYKLKGQDYYIFNCFDITNQKYCLPQEVKDIANEFGLKHVPIIDSCFSIDDMNCEQLLAIAEAPSLINPISSREGLVFKSLEEVGCMGKISFKCISNKYLLKHGG